MATRVDWANRKLRGEVGAMVIAWEAIRGCRIPASSRRRFWRTFGTGRAPMEASKRRNVPASRDGRDGRLEFLRRPELGQLAFVLGAALVWNLRQVSSFTFPTVANVSHVRLLAKRMVNMISSQYIAISVP